MTLTEFLLARIAEDEETARAEPDDPYVMQRMTEARMLAECAAKRRIVAAHASWHVCPNADGRGYTDHHDGSNPNDPESELCPTLLALSAVYATHESAPAQP